MATLTAEPRPAAFGREADGSYLTRVARAPRGVHGTPAGNHQRRCVLMEKGTRMKALRLTNAVVGLPSPSGNNNVVLDDASSALGFPTSGLSGTGTVVTGQQFSDYWHLAFD